MKYKNILLDVDGTLMDPGEGIINSFTYTLDYFGVSYKKEALYKYIGPPLRDSFKDMTGKNSDIVEEMVAKYREYYGEKGLYESFLYPGIGDLLASLKKQNITICTATSKTQYYTEKILKSFGIYEYFDFIGASEMNGERSEKPEIIRHVFHNMNITNEQKEVTVMIGDRKYDILGAKAAGIDAIGVLYGYGNKAELEEAGASLIAESVTDLSKILL